MDEEALQDLQRRVNEQSDEIEYLIEETIEQEATMNKIERLLNDIESGLDGEAIPAETQAATASK